jgi:hypothetical protein
MKRTRIAGREPCKGARLEDLALDRLPVQSAVPAGISWLDPRPTRYIESATLTSGDTSVIGKTGSEEPS